LFFRIDRRCVGKLALSGGKEWLGILRECGLALREGRLGEGRLPLEVRLREIGLRGRSHRIWLFSNKNKRRLRIWNEGSKRIRSK